MFLENYMLEEDWESLRLLVKDYEGSDEDINKYIDTSNYIETFDAVLFMNMRSYWYNMQDKSRPSVVLEDSIAVYLEAIGSRHIRSVSIGDFYYVVHSQGILCSGCNRVFEIGQGVSSETIRPKRIYGIHVPEDFYYDITLFNASTVASMYLKDHDNSKADWLMAYRDVSVFKNNKYCADIEILSYQLVMFNMVFFSKHLSNDRLFLSSDLRHVYKDGMVYEIPYLSKSVDHIYNGGWVFKGLHIIVEKAFNKWLLDLNHKKLYEGNEVRDLIEITDKSVLRKFVL